MARLGSGRVRDRGSNPCSPTIMTKERRKTMGRKKEQAMFFNDDVLGNNVCSGVEYGQDGCDEIISETSAVIIYLFTTVLIITTGAIVYFLL